MKTQSVPVSVGSFYFLLIELPCGGKIILEIKRRGSSIVQAQDKAVLSAAKGAAGAAFNRAIESHKLSTELQSYVTQQLKEL